MLNLLPSGHVIGKPAPLFAKIEQEKLDELKKRFAGKQQSNGISGGSSTRNDLDSKSLEAAIAKQVLVLFFSMYLVIMNDSNVFGNLLYVALRPLSYCVFCCYFLVII